MIEVQRITRPIDKQTLESLAQEQMATVLFRLGQERQQYVSLLLCNVIGAEQLSSLI